MKGTIARDPSGFQIENECDLLFGRAHPNPTREGCPPANLLMRLARRELPIDDSSYDHLGQCSPCYCEVRALQQAAASFSWSGGRSSDAPQQTAFVIERSELGGSTESGQNPPPENAESAQAIGRDQLTTNHPLRGLLQFWSETGTEGGYWAFQDERFIDPASRDWPFERWRYEGVWVLKDGDELAIFDKYNPRRRSPRAGAIG